MMTKNNQSEVESCVLREPAGERRRQVLAF